MKAIEASINEECCKANCMKTVLTKEDIVKTRKHYRELPEEGQRAFLLNFYITNQFFYNGKRHYTFLVNGKKVCRMAWMKAYSISPTT